ncbi:MAG: LysM peptidoglycan-binding domain-containing protein [Chloroflexota bacterium]
MTERGLPIADGAPACPFVAFEDDRESRSTSPDHRHRCYAEPVPAPRAAAHQEAYCLSSTFPVCPTFQDWARREAAHARGEGAKPAPAPTATATSGPSASSGALGPDLDEDDAVDRGAAHGSSEPPPIHRNPPRDWAAPPPWAPGGAGALAASRARRSAGTRGGIAESGPPDFLAGREDGSRGLAGSSADRLATGEDVADVLGTSMAAQVIAATSSVGADPLADEELARLVAPARVGDRAAPDRQPPPRPGNRPRVSSTRAGPPRDAIVGPAWERSRRYEAYPTIRTRVGLPQLPRLAVLAVALAIAALGLFFLPALLGVGGGSGGSGTSVGGPSPSVSQSALPSSPPAVTPVAATSQVYIVKAGDTMTRIAAAYGLKADVVCAANKDSITNCDKLQVGQEIVIPSKTPGVINDASASPSPS